MKKQVQNRRKSPALSFKTKVWKFVLNITTAFANTLDFQGFLIIICVFNYNSKGE